MQEILLKYLPAGAVPTIVQWIDHHKINLVITRERRTKLGDYRHPFRGAGHRITVNHNLNPYAFLLTLVHEIAHLVTWEKHKNGVKPHGPEWKKNFQQLMGLAEIMDCYPADLQDVLVNYLADPAASSMKDSALYKALRQHDAQVPEGMVLLEEIPLCTAFTLENGRPFLKRAKLRKFFLCTDLTNNKDYRVADVLVFPY